MGVWSVVLQVFGFVGIGKSGNPIISLWLFVHGILANSCILEFLVAPYRSVLGPHVLVRFAFCLFVHSLGPVNWRAVVRKYNLEICFLKVADAGAGFCSLRSKDISLVCLVWANSTAKHKGTLPSRSHWICGPARHGHVSEED